MVASPFLPVPSGLEIETICPGFTALTVHLTATAPTSACPLCGKEATRIHSRYHRTVADVPCGGRQVRLVLTVRKFFCDVPTCARRIFDSAACAFHRAVGTHDDPADAGAL